MRYNKFWFNWTNKLIWTYLVHRQAVDIQMSFVTKGLQSLQRAERSVPCLQRGRQGLHQVAVTSAALGTFGDEILLQRSHFTVHGL